MLNANNIPFFDQYAGIWAIREQEFNSLVAQAQSINVQLHLQQVAGGANPHDLEARSEAEDYEVTSGVAIINVTGSLMKHASSWSANSSMVMIRRSILSAVNSSKVNSILLKIDSPGGTVKGLQDLVETVQYAKTKKPVYAYVEDLAASAAYWIGSQATRMYGNTHAVVGSIGVFSVVYDMSRAAENEGIKVHVLTTGAFKGAGVPGAPISDAQLADFQRHVDAYHADFIAAVASGRGLSTEAVAALADGRVHRGRSAVDLRLLDGIQSIEKTISDMASIGQAPKKGQKAMSSETTVPAADTPTAATSQQIKQLCPNASSDFILAQIEAGATIEQVKTQWMAEQAKEIAALREVNARAKEQSANDSSRGRPGVAALADGAKSSEPESQQDDVLSMASINAEVNKIRKERGLMMAEAYSEYWKQNPKAREFWLKNQPPARQR